MEPEALKQLLKEYLRVEVEISRESRHYGGEDVSVRVRLKFDAEVVSEMSDSFSIGT